MVFVELVHMNAAIVFQKNARQRKYKAVDMVIFLELFIHSNYVSETLQLMADTTGVTSYNKGYVCSAIEAAITPSKQSYCSITGPSTARRLLAGSETTASAYATTTTTDIGSLQPKIVLSNVPVKNCACLMS